MIPGDSPGPVGGPGIVEVNYLEVADIGTPLTPGDYVMSFTYQGEDRFCEFHLPPGYVDGLFRPVILTMHGGGGYAALMRHQTRLEDTADVFNVIVVYLAGWSPDSPHTGLHFNTGLPMIEESEEAIDDVGYVEACLDGLLSFITYNANKVYATGLSNGATMCYKLLTDLPDRIAAFAPIAGHHHAEDFEPETSKPLLQFSGVLDLHNPYWGGLSDLVSTKYVNHTFPTVPDAVASWALGRVVASGNKTLGQADFKSWQVSNLDGGHQLGLWTLNDGGHTVPGGATILADFLLGDPHSAQVNVDISAALTMWTFFQAYEL